MIWHYVSGKWNKVNHNDLHLVDQYEGEDDQEYLARNGFEKSAALQEGPEWSMFYSIYSNPKRQSWIVRLSIHFDHHEVYIEDLPSLLMFLKEYRDLFISKPCDYVSISARGYMRKDAFESLYTEKVSEGKFRLMGQTKDGETFELCSCGSMNTLRTEFNIE